MKNRHFASLSVLAILIAVGCSGNGLSGKYTAKPMGIEMSMDFKSADKVTLTVAGQSKDASYKVDGDKIKITVDGKDSDFVREKDGTITNGDGQMKVVFKKG